MKRYGRAVLSWRVPAISFGAFIVLFVLGTSYGTSDCRADCNWVYEDVYGLLLWFLLAVSGGAVLLLGWRRIRERR